MKRNILIIYVLLSMLGFGCDVLKEDPKSILTPPGYYNTKAGIETLVNGCYARLMGLAASGEGALRVLEQGTDIFEAGVDGSINFDNYEIALTNGDISNMWQTCYIGINACNTVTHNIATVDDMLDAEKELREAEARFLRAYMYYHLIMQFGDVHLTTEPSEGVQTEANRTPANQILDEVIYPDLRYAVEHLPPSQSDYGRIDQYGAKFFLSCVLLSDKRSAQSQFDEAAELAVSVIEDSEHTLLASRTMVFDQANEMNAEIVWSVQYPSDMSLRPSGNQTHLFFVPKYDELSVVTRSILYGRPYARFKPTQFMSDLYDETIDSRYQAYWRDTWYANVAITTPLNLSIGDTAIYYPKYAWRKEQIDAKNYIVFNPENSENLGTTYRRVSNRYFIHLKKFDDTNRSSTNETSGTRDWVVFRLAEAYLLAGEAYFRGNDNVNALKYINILRRHCALPGKESDMEIAESDLSIDFILDERARELCGEGKRWYDLKRLDKLLERTMLYNSRASTTMKPHHILRPIPQSQIDRCSNEYSQNEGW